MGAQSFTPILTAVSLSVLTFFPPAVGKPRVQTQTLDRVVASVGGVAITQSDVEQEYRLEAFLAKGRVLSAPPDASELEKVQSRVIDQKLLTAELEGYRFDPGSIQHRADERMKTLRNKFASEAAFQDALQSLGMNEKQLMGYLERQEKILRMIDERLRTAATVDPKDIENYYQKTFLPTYTRADKGSPPPLAQVQSKIREVLVQKKINQLLDEWLSELRKEHDVEILAN